MSYKVIKAFTDLQDGNHLYEVGDNFPRLGSNPSPERIEELATDKNRQGVPLIAAVDEDPAKAEPEATVAEDVAAEEPVEEAPKKRGRKKQ